MSDCTLMSKRNKLFKEVPFDCWCWIIKFFHLPTDLLSLLLVVKGLDEYLKNRTANSTKNIEFYLHKIPKRTKNIVSQLYFSNRNPVHVGETILKKLGSSSLEIAFSRIFLKFPNLSSFNFSISGLYGNDGIRSPMEKSNSSYINNVYKSCGIFSSLYFTNIFSPCQYLKKLDLTFYETKLNIDHFFPKLKNLVLFRFGEVKSPIIGNENLIINWKKLPSLRKCHLSGWVVKSFSSEDVNILKRLDELKLDNTDSNEICVDRDEKEVIEDLKNIKILIIEDSSLRNFDTMSNLSTKSLTIGQGKYSEHHSRYLSYPIHIPSPLSIVDMLCLTTLIIEDRGFLMGWGDEEDIMNIKNLPLLQKVNLICITFYVSFKGVPSLRHIEAFYCSSIAIDVNDAPLMEFFSIDNTDFEKFEEWVNSHKNLKNITIIGDCGFEGGISFCDYPFLETVNVDPLVESFSNCPRLKNVKFFSPCEEYAGFITPVDHLKSFVVESLGGNDILSEAFFGQTLENVKMIETFSIHFDNKRDNVYLETCNVRNIRKLNIFGVNEFVISGNCSNEAAISVLYVTRCHKVEITGVLSLKSIFIVGVESEVVLKNCKNLGLVQIRGERRIAEKKSKLRNWNHQN